MIEQDIESIQIEARKNKIFGHGKDSQLVGRMVLISSDKKEIPLQNIGVSLWAKTRIGKRILLSEGTTNENGEIFLEFDLREARTWKNHSLHFEINPTTNYYFFNLKIKKPAYQLFRSITILKSDLIGMAYNLRTIQLYDKSAIETNKR